MRNRLPDTGPAELAYAARESVCYQTSDPWAAMRADRPDANAADVVLRVDGGMAVSEGWARAVKGLLASDEGEG
jgi:glycerol kinase